MKRNYIGVLLLGIFALLSCNEEKTEPTLVDEELINLIEDASNGEGSSFFVLPESNDFANIPQDPKNPLTKEKVALGKLLFHETGIAINPQNDVSTGNFSCASCHFASAGFQAGRFQGMGEGGIGFGMNGEGRVKGRLYSIDMVDVQPIKSPAALNIAYQKNVLWNGQFGATGLNANTEHAWTEGTPKFTNFLGYEGTETQAIAALAVHRMGVNVETMEDYEYVPHFKETYPELTSEESCSDEFAGLAIAAYERTLLANQAPFQRWLRGEQNAMTESQKKGAVLFFGKAQCVTCHTGPALNTMDFYALGMKDLYQIPEKTFKTGPDNTENLGRGGFTSKSEDMYRFKVPQLYNLKDSPFYGHGSSMRSVREVIEYKNNAIKENDNVPNESLSAHFKPLNLTNDEITALTDFLEEGLYDADLKRYEPTSIPSGNCFPFNDPMARSHLGCD